MQLHGDQHVTICALGMRLHKNVRAVTARGASRHDRRFRHGLAGLFSLIGLLQLAQRVRQSRGRCRCSACFWSPVALMSELSRLSPRVEHIRPCGRLGGAPNASSTKGETIQIGPVSTVRSLISEKSFLLTHCLQICVRKEISRPGFLDVNRYSVVHSIALRRVFLRYVYISIRIFGDSVSCPRLYGGLYGQNLPYKFKNSYDVTSRIATSKNHIELLVPGQI